MPVRAGKCLSLTTEVVMQWIWLDKIYSDQLNVNCNVQWQIKKHTVHLGKKVEVVWTILPLLLSSPTYLNRYARTWIRAREGKKRKWTGRTHHHQDSWSSKPTNNYCKSVPHMDPTWPDKECKNEICTA